MTKRGLWLAFCSLWIMVWVAYALFAPRWFVSFPLGMMLAAMSLSAMFLPVGKGEEPLKADRHNPEEWKKR